MTIFNSLHPLAIITKCSILDTAAVLYPSLLMICPCLVRSISENLMFHIFPLLDSKQKYFSNTRSLKLLCEQIFLRIIWQRRAQKSAGKNV